ncbi:extracellular solute-binding protein [Streptomyces sp. MS2A]|nr:extracellular solute-binding protein [Streptomyces sp. MS2A]
MPRLRPLRGPALIASVAAAVLVLTSCSSPGDAAPDSDTLVVSTFPFGVEQLQEAVIDPFTEKTGIEVEIATGSNSDRLSQLQLSDGVDPGVDIVMISDFYAALGQEDELFQQVDTEKVPALSEVADFAKDDAYLGPAYSYQLNGTLYRTDDLSAEQAADWELYGDKRFAGRLALPDIAPTAGQLTVSGVADAYGEGPYDVDAAFQVMGGWAPNVLQFYSSSTEVTNLITQGEIVAAEALNGFATELVAAGEPIAWTAPSKGAYMATNRVMIPTGAANVEAAHTFIDYLLSVEAQSLSADVVGDLPVNPGAEIPEKLRAVVGDIADDPIAAGYRTLDPTELVPTRKEWVERFAREVAAQ